MPRAALNDLGIDVVTAGLGVRHGFVGRRGGVSTGLFDSLNVGLGSSDDTLSVNENRRRVVDVVAPGAALVTVHQVHSNIVVAVTGAVADGDRPHADAMVAATPGLALGILTADCAPILLADADAGVIGAAHSGWKGALHDIAGATVAAMEALGARRECIHAAVGPCISRASYEVDAGFRERFVVVDDGFDGFFSRGRGDKYQFDLEGFVVMRLGAAGVRHVTALGIDTYSDADRWFSYRRMTHRQEADYGRQMAVIAL